MRSDPGFFFRGRIRSDPVFLDGWIRFFLSVGSGFSRGLYPVTRSVTLHTTLNKPVWNWALCGEFTILNKFLLKPRTKHPGTHCPTEHAWEAAATWKSAKYFIKNLNISVLSNPPAKHLWVRPSPPPSPPRTHCHATDHFLLCI